MKKTITFVLLMSLAGSANAALSWFSRANCMTLNESITWDPYARYWLWTYTAHSENFNFKHGWNTGWRLTWRSYAGHSDNSGYWVVKGNHYTYRYARVQKLGSTYAVNCNLTQW